MATGDQYAAGLRHSTTGELYTRSDPTSTTTVAVSTPGMAAIGFYGQINPYGTTRVTVEPSALFTDTIDGSTIDTAKWTTGGTSAQCKRCSYACRCSFYRFDLCNAFPIANDRLDCCGNG